MVSGANMRLKGKAGADHLVSPCLGIYFVIYVVCRTSFYLRNMKYSFNPSRAIPLNSNNPYGHIYNRAV